MKVSLKSSHIHNQRELWRWLIMACSDSILIWRVRKGWLPVTCSFTTEKCYGDRRWMAWVPFTVPTPYWVYNINYRLVNSYPENMLTLICFEFHTTHSHTNTPICIHTVSERLVIWQRWLSYGCREKKGPQYSYTLKSWKRSVYHLTHCVSGHADQHFLVGDYFIFTNLMHVFAKCSLQTWFSLNDLCK